MEQQRHLAAILFADIAGYTALMQRDEQAALEKLALFKQTLEAKTAEFQGQIIQYYGDGCLVVFDGWPFFFQRENVRPLRRVLFTNTIVQL